MRKVAAISLVMVLATSSAFGTAISFGPNEVVIDLSDPNVDTKVKFDLTIGAPDVISSYEFADIVVGSDDLAFQSFEYSDDFIAATIFRSGPPFGPFDPENPFYTNEYFLGGFLASLNSEPLLLGSLVVDAAGLGLGEYSVMVDVGRDGNVSVIGDVAGSELVSGMAIVHIVPEPATIALLGLGAIGLLRRRRSA